MKLKPQTYLEISKLYIRFCDQLGDEPMHKLYEMLEERLIIDMGHWLHCQLEDQLEEIDETRTANQFREE